MDTFKHIISVNGGLITMELDLPLPLQKYSLIMSTTGIMVTITDTVPDVVTGVHHCEATSDSLLLYEIEHKINLN